MADKSKLACAEMALSFVKQGMTVGLGTGSTAEIFIDLLGKKNNEEGMDLTCVATSRASDEQAKRLGLPVVEFSKIDSLDAAFDGADQVDPKLNLIKGLGGALVREKIVDYRARRFYVMAGENKLVKALSGIVPVEIIPMSEEHVRRELVGMGASSAATRADNGRKFMSDNGNLILHADFGKIADPSAMERDIMQLPGVVDNGIFTSRNVAAVVGKPDGSIRMME